MKDIPLPKLRLDFLDGIRGWASVMVLLHHIIVRILANTTPAYQSPYLAFITDGHLAVFIFFILSGFALSITFIKRPHKVSFAFAIITRYFRLAIPILFTSLIVYVLLKNHLLFNVQIAVLSNSKEWLGSFYDFEASLAGLLKFCFYDVFFNFERSTSYNIVLWTMPIEYAGSLLIYLFVGVFRQKNQKLYWFFLATVTLYLLKNNPEMACFILGYFLAEVYFSYWHIFNKMKFVNSFAVLLLIIPIIVSTFYRPIDNNKYTAFLAFLLVVAITFSPMLQNLFSCSVSRFLGKISFPLYLIHLVVICFWSSYVFLHLTEYGYEPQAIANFVLATTVILSIFLAWVISPIENFSVKASKYLSNTILTLFRSKTRSVVHQEEMA